MRELMIIKKVKKILFAPREYRHMTKGFFKNQKTFSLSRTLETALSRENYQKILQ